MAKKEEKTYSYDGKEYTAEELDKILEQHEKRKEYRSSSSYDPEKAKAYREKRMKQLEKDPEAKEKFLAARKAYQRKRQQLQKDAMAFAKSKPEEFEKFRKKQAA